MTNLTSLTTVGFSDTDLGIREPFAVGCPKLQTLNIDNSQYRFIDGGLYYWSSKEWLLRFYCPGVKNSVLNIPSWRAGVENACNLNENPYLKTLNLHENCSRFPSAVPQQLEAIHVAAGNTHAFSQDGVLFEKSSGGEYTSSVYSPGKRDKSFTVPENVTLTTSSAYLIPNPYLETLRIPKSSTVGSTSSVFLYNTTFPNLKTVYFEDGSSLISYVQSHFTGTLIVY